MQGAHRSLSRNASDKAIGVPEICLFSLGPSALKDSGSKTLPGLDLGPKSKTFGLSAVGKPLPNNGVLMPVKDIDIV